MSPDESSRSVRYVLPAIRTVEGAGFIVHRPFPTRALDHVDPFLLLDEMGPMDVAPGEAKGAPDHPHRGFETVTYLLSGEMEHRDSAGHAGRLRPGDVQWMTAGGGVIHSEMPSAAFQRSGGRLHGFQLWVNLPRKDKRVEPRYQEIPAEDVPVATLPGEKGTVRVIAGEALGTKARVETRTPITYLHAVLEAGARFETPAPAGQNAFAYVISGEGRFGREARPANRAQLVMFSGDGARMAVENPGPGPLSVLLLAGAPIGEPVARYGPFVMNTHEEIAEAIRDFQTGRFGAIRG